MAAREPEPIYCSFCGKAQHECEVLLAGPWPVFICETCVDDAVAAVARKRREDAWQAKLNREAVRCAFCLPEPL